MQVSARVQIQSRWIRSRSSAPNQAAQSKLPLAPMYQREPQLPRRTFPRHCQGRAGMSLPGCCHLPAGSSRQLSPGGDEAPRVATPKHHHGGRQSQNLLKLGAPKPHSTTADLQSPLLGWQSGCGSFPQLPQQRNVRKPQPQPERGQNLINLSSGTLKLVFAWLQDLRAGQAAVKQLLHIVLKLKKALSHESWNFPGSSQSLATLPITNTTIPGALPVQLSPSIPQPEREELNPMPHPAIE